MFKFVSIQTLCADRVRDASKRPTTTELLNHPFLTGALDTPLYKSSHDIVDSVQEFSDYEGTLTAELPTQKVV
jgi:hypothetical protein